MNQVLDYLYRRSRSTVFRLIAKRGGNAEDQADALQTGVIAFYTAAARGRFRGDSSIKSYICRCALNWWSKQLQGRKIIEDAPLFVLERAFPTEPNKEITAETAALVQAAVEQTGNRCATVLRLQYFCQWPLDEIAPYVGLANANSVKTTSARCRTKFALAFAQLRRKKQ